MSQTWLIRLLLRLSIASVFLYAAVASTLQPYNWIGFIPQVFYGFAPPQILLIGFSLFQLTLALWILSGWKAFFSSVLASVTLLGIITANFKDVDILFRDFAIFFAAIALAAISFHKSSKKPESK